MHDDRERLDQGRATPGAPGLTAGAGRAAAGVESPGTRWRRMRSFFGRRRRRLQEQSLALECEHFLDGTYERYCEAERLPVPLWARLNAVAHGSTTELVEMALASSASKGGASRSLSWPDARARMAEALLRSAAVHGVTPAELQHSTLVPLESLVVRFGHDRQGGRAHDPERLLAIVETALRSHPSAPRPPGWRAEPGGAR